MANLGELDDAAPLPPAPASRVRRAFTVGLLLTLVVSMVFLAWVSGRGEVSVRPVASPPPTARPVAAVPRRLAIVDAAGHLVTTDAIGGSPVTYGAAAVAYTLPAWSPDGSHIAVIGVGATDTGVYVFATAEGATAAPQPSVIYRSADRPPFYLYWAPDGERVTFLTTEPDGLALRLAPADASTPAVAIRHGSPMYWTWVDPERILVHSGGDGPEGFFGEVGIDGISVEPTTVQPGGFRAPAVTGDGRFRAYVAPGNGSKEQVVIERRDGSHPQETTVFGSAAIDFGPDTHTLAFIAPDEASPQVTLPLGPLRVMDSVSGKVRTLLAGSNVGFFWAPDGQTIAALQLVPPGDDKVAGGESVTLASVRTPAERRPADAAVLGIALRLAFLDVGAGTIRSQRAIRVPDTFAGQLLPYFDQYALSHRVWSPDSASIVLPIVADDGATRLTVVQADGSDARPVADGAFGFWSP
jgi:TolB protein